MEQQTFIVPSRARLLSPAEHAAFSRYCRKTSGPERLFLLYLLIRYTGLRISEALAVTRDDVFDGYEIRRELLATTAKQRTKVRRRNVSLCSPKDILRTEIKRHLKTLPTNSGLSPLFATATGKPWERTSCTHALYETCDRAGVRRFSWHDLRHSYGQVILDHTGSLETVAAALGHSSIAVTKHYIHPRLQVLHDVNVATK